MGLFVNNEGQHMRHLAILGLLLCAAGMSPGQEPREALDLSGTWSFRLDPDDAGVSGNWQDGPFPDTISLPGSTNEAGYGRPVDELHVEYLTPLREYVGPAWYARDIEIPESWAGRRVVLFLERCHWESQLWVDGKHVSMRDSLCVPHEHDLGTSLVPGKHGLVLRIDNRIKYKVGPNAHSVTAHTQTNWNGVIGRIELRASDLVWLESLQVYPNVEGRSVRVRAVIGNATGEEVAGEFIATCGAATAADTTTLKPGAENVRELSLQLDPETPCWDEFSPALIDLGARVSASVDGRAASESRTVRFGMRAFGREGRAFLMNGRPTFLRGNLECCIFPMTGYPATNTESWLRMFRIARDYGLNHVRFHSWCPPEAAFDAADELGIMLHVETPIWCDLGKDQPTDDFIYAESDRILEAYGNHPSFCMLAVGNEPSGPKKDAFLAKIVAYWQQKDPRRLYTTCAGWPELPGSDYHVIHAREGKPYRLHGGPLGPTTAFDYGDVLAGADAPPVAHELGQWCVYPNYDEIAKYTGALRARNLEAFRASLEKNGLLDQADAFTQASGALQTLLYKADIEAVLRSPGAAGFQLLSLQDFPGQGSALVGFLDAFWGSKGYTPPEQFRRFCSECVPLLRIEKFVWTAEETLSASAEAAHYGRAPLPAVTPFWTVTRADGNEVASGVWPTRDLPLGNGIALGNLELPLAGIEAPARLTITVGLKDTPYANDWNVWVYPAVAPEPEAKDVLIAESLDEQVEQALRNGGRVLLYPAYLPPRTAVASAFEPVFWNTQWFPGQRRQLGVLCDPAHPAFALFPNDGYTDWQWWPLLNGATVMNLDSLGAPVRPVVQIVDDWNKNRRLAAVFEAQVGAGRLLVCSLPKPGADADAATRWFHASLLRYAASEAFQPATPLSPDAVRELFSRPEVSLVRVDSEDHGYEGLNAVDGDPATIWHTPWKRGLPKHPHEIVLELRERRAITGLRLLPRQDVANGFVAAYRVFVGDTTEDWGRSVASGELDRNAEMKEIRFHEAVEGKFIRFVAEQGFDGECFTAIAEIEPILD